MTDTNHDGPTANLDGAHEASIFDHLDGARPERSPLSGLPGGVRRAPCVARALIADDDEVLLHILGYQLTSRGWSVTTSGDGGDVLARLRHQEIDVLVVDLNLPHRNAFEILEVLRRSAARPGVIVMSEQAQEDKVVRAFTLGADDFVHKPFNPRVLLSRLERLVERR